MHRLYTTNASYKVVRWHCYY